MSLQLVYEDSLMGAEPTYDGQRQGFSVMSSLSFLPEFNQSPYSGVCSLEWNSWRLESWNAPAEQMYIPYWGNVLSDEKGVFSQPPELEIRLSQCTSASGLTMRFWPEAKEWCSRFTARWYRNQTLLAKQTFYPTAANFTGHRVVKNFDRVVLHWEQTNKPYRFPKLQGLIIGQKLIFGEEHLVSVQRSMGSDPIYCDLDKDTVTLEIRDPSRPICPQERQKLQLFRDQTCIAEGIVTSARTLGQGHCILQCQTPLAALEDQFWGGVYWSELAYDVARKILDDTYDFYIDNSIFFTRVSGYLGVCTRRKALQQLAFAIGARMVFKDGKLHFLPQEKQVTGKFGINTVFLGGELKTQAPVVSLEVTAHSYTLAQEEKLLLDGVEVNGENIRLRLPSPAEECRVEGGSLVDYGVNYVIVSANGPVRVWGIPIEHHKTIHSRRRSGTGRNVRVNNYTLVNPYNVEAVMDRLTEAFSNRQILKQEVIFGDQFAGQLIRTPTPWGGELEGHITAIEATLTPRGQTATVTVQGQETR